MNQKPKKQKEEQAQDVNVENTMQRLRNNRNDDIDSTFCYQLFENSIFDESLFFELCTDMEYVLKESKITRDDAKLFVWIISSIVRSVFSHYDKADLYKIKDFNKNLSEKWNNEYLEKLRSFLSRILDSII